MVGARTWGQNPLESGEQQRVCHLQGSWLREGVALGIYAVLNTLTWLDESPNHGRVTWCYRRPTAQAGSLVELLVQD